MKYAIVIEKAARNYSAYVPDLPGCIATGRTLAQTKRNIAEAIAFHIDGLREDGLAIPKPSSAVGLVPVRGTGRTKARRVRRLRGPHYPAAA